MIKYRVKETEELRNIYSFLHHIGYVAISEMIDNETARVYDVEDGIEFTIDVKHLVPVK